MKETVCAENNGDFYHQNLFPSPTPTSLISEGRYGAASARQHPRHRAISRSRAPVRAMRSTSASPRPRRVSLRNLSTTSCSLANFCSLPRGASTVSVSRVPSLKMHLDPHLVAQLGAEGGDRGVVHRLDLGGERHAAGIGDDGVGELVDEHVALGEQRRDAERQVHLRRGQALRPIRPADMVDGRLRAVHHDLGDVVGRERVARLRWCGSRRGSCGCCRRRNRISARRPWSRSARRDPRSARRA